MNYWKSNLENLVPAVYRLRDSEQKFQFTALLKVIAEQMDILHEDVQQLYSDWFIETCQHWCVPYVGDLVGFREQFHGELPKIEDSKRLQARDSFLFPRAEVANAVRSRRKKGTANVMKQLVKNVAGWKGSIKDNSTSVARVAGLLDGFVPFVGDSPLAILSEPKNVKGKSVPSQKVIELEIHRHNPNNPLNMLRGLGGGNYPREDQSNYAASTHIVRVWQGQVNWGEIFDPEKEELRYSHTIIEFFDDTEIHGLPLPVHVGQHQTLELKARRSHPKLSGTSFKFFLSEHSKLVIDGFNVKDELAVSPLEGKKNGFLKTCATRQNSGNPQRPTLKIRHSHLEQKLELKIPGVVVEVSDSVVNDFETDLIGLPAFVVLKDSVVLGRVGSSLHIRLSAFRSTVLGKVNVREVWAQDCIFVDQVKAANQQTGGLRFCYEPSDISQSALVGTPARYQCLPDILPSGERETVDAATLFYSIKTVSKETSCQFCVIRLDTQNKLVEAIRNGSEVESEMGVYHDLYLPQRERNLQQWLDEFTPAGMQTKIKFKFEEVGKK